MFSLPKNLKFKKLFFGHKKLKKSLKKVAYLSRISVVSEMLNSPNGRIHVPNVAYRATVYRTGIMYIHTPGES